MFGQCVCVFILCCVDGASQKFEYDAPMQTKIQHNHLNFLSDLLSKN